MFDSCWDKEDHASGAGMTFIRDDQFALPGMDEVANRGDCQKMAQRFRQQGRNLRLARIKPSRDKILKYICIFEGADAGIDVFENNRSK